MFLSLLFGSALVSAPVPDGGTGVPTPTVLAKQAITADATSAERWTSLVQRGLEAWGVGDQTPSNASRLKATITRVGRQLRVLAEFLPAHEGGALFRKTYRTTDASLANLAVRAVDDIAKHEIGSKTPASKRLIAVQEFGAGSSEIVLTNGEGTSVIPLTRHGSRTLAPTAIRRGRFAYVTYVAGPPQLWGMELHTRKAVRLLDPHVSGNPSHPALSPDGHTVAYLDTDKKGRQAIRLLNWDSGETQNLTDFRYGLGAPAWSPDGRCITYIEECRGTDQLVIQTRDGSIERRYGSRGASLRDPAWHPTDPKLVFVKEQAGVWLLMTLDWETERSEELLRSGSPLSSPRWSPAREWLSYSDGTGVRLIHTHTKKPRVLSERHVHLRSPRWEWE